MRKLKYLLGGKLINLFYDLIKFLDEKYFFFEDFCHKFENIFYDFIKFLDEKTLFFEDFLS